MLFVGVLSFTLCDPAVGHAANHIKSLTVITEVFGDGQNISAAAIEYDKNIDNGKLSSAVFTVMGRTITKVYTSDAPTKSVQGVNGRFVVLELSVADPGASVISQRGRTATDTDVKVSVTQAGDVLTTDGEKYESSSETMTSTNVVNLVVDDFKQFEYKDPKTGQSLKYNLLIPKSYDEKKSYPLVLFMHDAGTTSNETKTTLIQGLGAIIWATPSEQAKHESFVLAPQYSTQIVNDNSEASEYLDITVDLVKTLANQYSIDKDRLYTTGQSGGCMMSIAIDIKYPDLFAARFLLPVSGTQQKYLQWSKTNSGSSFPREI